MQTIQFGYGFIIPYREGVNIKDIILSLQEDISKLEEEDVNEIKYCWDETLPDKNLNKRIFVYASGYCFENGIIPHSFTNFTDVIKIPTVLKDGTTKNLDQLYKKYINRNINYYDISWKFFSFYSSPNKK